jgi:hypothetical protein
MRLDFIDEILREAVDPGDITGRTPHPEDAIFDSSQSALQMVKSMEAAIKNPSSLTIKWDGFPALVFGRLANGKLAVMDKYMYDNRDKTELGVSSVATSPQGWVDYDQSRGKPRTDGNLYQSIANIWPGLDQAVGSSPGFFWGDLLWGAPLEPVNGNYVFRPNPWGVTYTIPLKIPGPGGMMVANPIANTITGRTGGIVVHQYIPSAGASPQPWNGQGLNLQAPVAILTPTANVKFTLSDPVRLHKQAVSSIAKNGALADKFMQGLDDKGRMAVKQYANKLITRQTTDLIDQWLVGANFSQKLKKFMIGDNQSGYLYRNKKGLDAVFAIWNAVYALKINLTDQLEKQVKGIEQSIDGQPAGEGFVFSSPTGPVKLVNRGVFSAALFARAG